MAGSHAGSAAALIENFGPLAGYTNELAVRDGLKVRVGLRDAPIYVDTTVVRRLGAIQGGRVDSARLMRALRRIVHAFFREGRYADPGAAPRGVRGGPEAAYYRLPDGRSVVRCWLEDGFNVTLA